MGSFLVKGSQDPDSPYMWWSTAIDSPVHVFVDENEAMAFLLHRSTDECWTCVRERAQARVVLHRANTYGSSAEETKAAFVIHVNDRPPFHWNCVPQRVGRDAPPKEPDEPLYHYYLRRAHTLPYMLAVLAQDVPAAHSLLDSVLIEE